MFDEIKNIKSGRSDIRKFGITIGIILLIIAGFLFYQEKDSFRILVGVATALIVSGIIIPIILKPLYLIWMIITTILGWFMTRLILSLIFFVIVSPIGLVSRLLGKDYLSLNKDDSIKSYWNYRDRDKEKNQDYEKQF